LLSARSMYHSQHQDCQDHTRESATILHPALQQAPCTGSVNGPYQAHAAVTYCVASSRTAPSFQIQQTPTDPSATPGALTGLRLADSTQRPPFIPLPCLAYQDICRCPSSKLFVDCCPAAGCPDFQLYHTTTCRRAAALTAPHKNLVVQVPQHHTCLQLSTSVSYTRGALQRPFLYNPQPTAAPAVPPGGKAYMPPAHALSHSPTDQALQPPAAAGALATPYQRLSPGPDQLGRRPTPPGAW
jgi:hypothetical protein